MVKTLVLVRLRSFTASLRGKKKDGTTGGVGRMLILALAYLYLGGVFLLMFTGAAISFAPVMISAGLDALYFAIFMLISFSLIFFFSVFETKAHLFECRDNELLMAMPIKPGDIVLSRVIVVLILNYIEGAVAFLPALIAYAAFGGSVFGIIGGTLVFLTLPLLATSLSSGVGYLVALLSKRFKNNSFIPLVLTLAFLALYFWGYSALLSVPEEELENLENIIPALESALAPVAAIGLSAMLHPIATPVFVAISLGASYVAYRAVSRGYAKVASPSDSLEKKKYKSEPSHRSSVFVALAKKELRKFISSATYMLNGAMGAVMYIVLAVAGAMNSESLILTLDMLAEEIGLAIDYKAAIPAIAIAALVLVSSTVTVSASALSLEGKSYSILKSMPIGPRTVILSKLVPHVLVGSAASLIASVILVISFGIEPLYAVFVILTPIIANIFTALVGITMNILLPKLEFENEVQPIKQSAAVGLTMLITMVIAMTYLGVSFFLSLMGLGAFAVIFGAILLLLLSAIFAILVFIPLARRLDSISA